MNKHVVKATSPKETLVSKVSRGVHLRQAIHEAAEVGKALAAAKKQAPPTDSWWIGLDRQTFYAECARRHPDIAASDEGRKVSSRWTTGRR